MKHARRRCTPKQAEALRALLIAETPERFRSTRPMTPEEIAACSREVVRTIERVEVPWLLRLDERFTDEESD